jgi:hypothetical protein
MLASTRTGILSMSRAWSSRTRAIPTSKNRPSCFPASANCRRARAISFARLCPSPLDLAFCALQRAAWDGPFRRILVQLDAQPKAIRADADQFCAATHGGRFMETRGTGNPELDGATRDAGNLGDRPLVVLTAGRFWAPPGLEKEAADYHEIWVHQLQPSLAALSTRGRQVVVDAHHDMDEAPDAVVIATQKVVTEVRGKK